MDSADREKLRNKILKYCTELGIDTVGFMRCRRFEELRPFFEDRKFENRENEFEEKDIEKRINPLIYMEDGKAIISIAFPYLHEADFGSYYNFSKYAHGNDYHAVASKYLKLICSYIESLDGKAIYFTDNNALPERYIASQCRIGFLGKNNMLITERYGSYVFLGEIITNLDLVDEKYVESVNKTAGGCGECEICLKACPTESIRGEQCDPNICLSYITQKKHIDEFWFDKLKGRIFGCDTCQRACPYNKNVKLSQIEEFKPLEYMKNVDINELLEIDNKIFKEKYHLTSSGWRGKNLLQRNALINVFNKGENESVKEKKFSSPYVKDYYDRLLKHFKL